MPAKSRAPSETVLKKIYHDQKGSITTAARALGVSRGTAQEWFARIGLNGTGKGGMEYQGPSVEELTALYYQHGGNFNRMSEASGTKADTIRKWCNRAGLKSTYRQKFERTYPREIAVDLPDGHIVIFSDAHFWTEDKTPAHEALLKAIKRFKPVAIIANGDILDGARISRHDPSGLDETPTFSDELTVCQKHMAEIKRISGGCETFLTMGNHDSRFSKYVAKGSPELLGIQGARLDHHLLGWRFCWSVRINGHTLVMHRFRGGQHATFTNLLRSGMNIVTGHLHSQRVYPFSDANGTKWGVDAGCLADVHGSHGAYTEAAPLDWRSGFVVLTLSDGELEPPQLATVVGDQVYLQRNEVLWTSP